MQAFRRPQSKQLTAPKTMESMGTSILSLTDPRKHELGEYYIDQNPETLYIAPDCGLQLQLNIASAHSKEFGLDYKVGNIHQFPLTSQPKEIRGWLSPMHELTLPPEEKLKAGIPEDAKQYSYVYAPKNLADYIDWDKVMAKASSVDEKEDDSDYSWAMPFVASFGAYAYFDGNLKLLRVNAISLQKTRYRLNFEGPFVALDSSFEELHDLNRYQSLYVDTFREVGFAGVAWIDPNQNSFIDHSVEGQEEVQNHHGGFLYFRYDKTALLMLIASPEITTPPKGIGSILRDTFRLCKHEIKNKSLSMSCPPVSIKPEFEIHFIVKDGSMEHLQYVVGQNLMSQSKLLTTKDHFGWTPLHYACCYHPRNHEMIKFLVDNGSDAIYVTNINGLLPIHIACQNNPSLEVINILIKADKQKQTVRVPSKHHGFLPIHFACCNEKISLEVITAVIDADTEDTNQGQFKYPSLYHQGKLGWTPLYACIASNANFDVIDKVLEESDTDYTIGTKFPVLFERVNGLLPLQLACLKGMPADVIKLLIQVEPDYKTFYDVVKSCDEYKLENSTILHIALANSPKEVIDVLLMKEVKARCMLSSYFVDLHSIQEGYGGMVPLHVACGREELDSGTIKTLLRLRRTSVFAKDNDGNTPLHLVCMNPNVTEDVIQMLLESEEQQNMNEQLKKSNKQIVVEESSDMEMFDDNGTNLFPWSKGAKEDTALSAARTANNEGKTPLFLATHAGATQVHDLIEPDVIALRMMGDEEKDLLLDMLLANGKVQEKLVINLSQFQYFFFIFLELVLNIAATFVYFRVSSSVFLESGTVGVFDIAFLASCIFIFLLRELTQFLGSTTYLDYFLDAWNWVELSSLVFLIINTAQLIELLLDDTVRPNASLFIVSGCLLILQFILIVRTTFLPFARFVAGLIAILAELIPFAVISLMFLFMFTYSFLLSGQRTEVCPDFGACLMWTLEGFFYGVDGFQDTPIMDIFFGVLAVVMLLNVVIAIVSNAWDDAEETTREVFWKSRIEVLFQYRKLFRNHVEPLQRLNQKYVEFAPLKTDSAITTVLNIVKNVFFFFLGLVTLGIFWPKSLRRRILSAGMDTE